MSSDGCETRWLRDLQAGDGAAAGSLWERYFSRLVHLARSRLQGGVPLRAAGPEDVALSAFASFCRRVDRGQLPLREGAGNLWPLLAKITVRKAAALARREGRRKRGGGAVRGESVWADEAGPGAEGRGIEQVLEEGPTPEAVAAAAEECRRLLDALRDPTLREVALLKLDGYSNDEIAGTLKVTTRTVERKLGNIRRLWELEEGAR